MRKGATMRIKIWWTGEEKCFQNAEFEPLRGSKFVEWLHPLLPRVGEVVEGTLLFRLLGDRFFQEVSVDDRDSFIAAEYEVIAIVWDSDGDGTYPVLWM